MNEDDEMTPDQLVRLNEAVDDLVSEYGVTNILHALKRKFVELAAGWNAVGASYGKVFEDHVKNLEAAATKSEEIVAGNDEEFKEVVR